MTGTRIQDDTGPAAAGIPVAPENSLAALAVSRRELAVALREIKVLQRRESHSRRQVARLEQSLEKAGKFAYHDELTNLPNRRLLFDRFKQAAAQSQRQGKQVALLYLDLDGFKYIDDTLGHEAGDRLLQEAAARLSACIRLSDTACRYGGDEFVVLLPGIESGNSAAAAAQKIRKNLAKPYVVDDSEIKLTVSIGMAVYPVERKKYRDLINLSDHAMYVDKARGAAPPSVLPLEVKAGKRRHHGANSVERPSPSAP
jgi:diguanylate cyclase (GGDEF)-like protein